jgi:hypothetical protein
MTDSLFLGWFDLTYASLDISARSFCFDEEMAYDGVTIQVLI